MDPLRKAFLKSIQSKNLAFAVANASNDGIMIIDGNHKISFVNKVLKSWLLWSDINADDWLTLPDEEVYRQLCDLTVSTNLLKAVTDSVQGKENLIAETLDIEWRNEIYKYINVYTAPMVMEDGDHVGRIWIFDDRTKETRIERAKTEFISIASHQLRTPLSAITGYLSMIIDGDAGEIEGELKEFIEAAYEGADRLAEIVEDLLKISRLEMGSTAVEKEKKNLSEVFDRITAPYVKLANEKGVLFKEDYDFDDLEFKLDENLLSHIVGNILDNAIKYTPSGSEVWLKARAGRGCRKINDKACLIVDIVDSGIGIPKEQQNRIFEKFFRADNVRKEDFQGTGIGLYYVKKLVDALGGRISFKSGLNKGTRFSIVIPE
ncbi:hypothetical protein GF357_05250 [Candidatus Dojkabacteria bacterium]|nr:hypothetical protein [Candidatus Dojkabacteria bacterium]